jgi:hypothetical protein
MVFESINQFYMHEKKIMYKQKLQLGQKTRDGNHGQQGLGPLRKSVAGFDPTRLKVENSPRLQGKFEC